ncbi:cysteine peptidase C50 [Lyophyllum atratum]|nr:cysteine peptidase C50 [Lyophyllum atratum]
MASTTTRRLPSSRMPSKSARPRGVSVDKLAEQLTSGLTITDAKGKQKALVLSEEQVRLESMRAVNSASQALSAAVQSGWKKSSGKQSPAAASATSSAAKHLAVLRKVSSGDINVERAAMSVLGKLVALEMYEDGMSALESLHPRICALHNVIPTQPRSSSRFHQLSIPFPSSDVPVDLALLTLTTTYLTYALTIVTHFCFTPNQITKELASDLDAFSHALCTTEPTLLAWIPRCVKIPSKQLDPILTRAYTSLTRACATHKSNHQAVFSLRIYAVMCLAHTSAGTSRTLLEEEATRAILSTFSDLVDRTEKRSDASTFLGGSSFVEFCEYWIVLAKRVGDICLVDRIAGIIQGISMARHHHPNTQDAYPEQQILLAEGRPGRSTASFQLLDYAATLAQTTAAMEQKSPDLPKRVQEATSTIKGSKCLLHHRRISGKVDRAMERMRRVTVSALDSWTRSLHDADNPLQLLLLEIANVLQQQCSSPQADSDTFTRTLDTLFVLARTQLLPSDPRTYVPAHDTLTKASELLEPRIADPTAGTLYQAGRHGGAIGFLKDALRRNAGMIEEGWKQLEEQLYRRWELLGVCFSKLGDRKQALQSFHHCIKTFPYSTCGFAERAAKTGLSTLFDLSSGTKQLGTIIDRVTHISACELLMEPSAVSLGSIQIDDPGVLGALLERQIESLDESRHKEEVPAVVYGQDMPVRRARVLAKYMECMYHVGTCIMKSPEDIGGEIEGLLQSVDYGRDTGVAGFGVQYRIAAHLWQALHAHRRMEVKQSVLIVYHIEGVCKLLKPVLDGSSEPKSGWKSSPKQITAPKKPVLGPPTRQRLTRRAVVAREPVTPKPKSRKALQPVSLNARTPPRQVVSGKSSIVFDDFERLLALIQLTATVSGVLGLILPKVHLLDVSRKLCDQQLGIHSDGYIMNSVDLAYEYIKLGKTRRAAMVFNQALNAVRSGNASDDACASFFLRFAESSTVYCEALSLSESFDKEDKALPTIQRVRARGRRLEKAAVASHVVALIQYSKNDVTRALDGMLQSLRLWNRAIDTLVRLHPSPSAPSPLAEDNVFLMSGLNDGLPKEPSPPKKTFPRQKYMDALEWRISEGLLATLFSLVQLYLNRGSAREAEYFAEQARDLAESLNVPTMVSRALAKKGEIQLYRGHLDASLECLTEAAALLENTSGMEKADVRRLHGIYNERMSHHVDADELYEESMGMLDELDQVFKQFDGVVFGSKSIGSSPTTKPAKEVVLPELLAAVLRQRIWLLRDSDVQDYTVFLDKFLALPHSSRTKAEENALMAKLTLHAVYSRFRGDMFLSSLAESTIAIPMGMVSKVDLAVFIAKRGNVTDVRDAVLSLALVRAFQTSLGKPCLLDASAAITLRREMLETIQHKFPLQAVDDAKWPLIRPDGSLQPPLTGKSSSRFSFDTALDPLSISSSQTSGLPSNWTVVHINVTEDKSTLFITRQECGDPTRTPLIFCVPLKGRRDNGGGIDEEHLTFEDAIDELKEIVRLSDEGTKAAVRIKTEDQEARAAWWKERNELDTRLRELLENVEFCWLGAFKTILSPRPNLTPDLISDLRCQFEKVFHRSLHVQDKRTKQRSGTHKKSASQSQSQAFSQVTFDDALLECFSTLSPKCRDEELEDLVYFILDLYQFHGAPVAIAEVDIIQVVLDLRAGLPWESIPILRGRSVSRIPSVDFLHDRILFVEWKRQALGIEDAASLKGAVVDPRKGYYILNPSGDLDKTEGRFKDWVSDMEKAGWEGITGCPPSEQQFLNALRDRDLVVYFGHGGGEQYLRSHKIRNLPRCAVTMLWGCSSGALRDMGDFDRVGTPYNYMLAGCPCLVANLWDVTDRDIDKFSQTVFDKLGMTASGTSHWGRQDGQVSVVDAVGQSRNSCKLKYLTGAAPIVYGIPFYL